MAFMRCKIISTVLLFSIITSTAMHSSKTGDTVEPYSSNSILIKIKNRNSRGFIRGDRDRYGSRVKKSYSLVDQLHLVQLPHGISVEKALVWYKNQPEVEYAEPNNSAFNFDTIVDNNNGELHSNTNDTSFSTQWSLNNTGQSGGTVDADINGPETWAIQPGSRVPVIGVIDSGVDYNHNDLQNNLWQNSGEIPANSIDDDGNGYIDDIYGINAITGSGNPFDDFHHGTRISGIIGAVSDNSLGIAGVMNVANIANCKFLSSSGAGSASDAIECMQYFANLKSRTTNSENIVAVNSSWVIAKSQALYDAIASLRALGIIFIAAAGNSGINIDQTPIYPASYQLSNIITVAATDRNDLKPSYSNYGKTGVHLAAPGSSIISTIPNQGYSTSSGTSMAAPHVSGLIGLLAAHFPGYAWHQLKNLAIAGGKPLTNLQSITTSGRRLRGADNAGLGSLSCVNQTVKARSAPVNSSAFVAINSTLFLQALNINCEAPNGNLQLYNDGTTSIVLVDDGTNGDDYSGDGVYSLNWVPTIAGNYALDFGNGDVVNVRVYDPSTWRGYSASIDTSFTAENFTGISLGGGDETLATLASPFPILFGGDTAGFSTIYISSNGTVSFTDPVVVSGANTPLPISIPSTLIALYWDDLTFTQVGAAIYYQVSGTAPNRKLVIEWRNAKHFNTTGIGTFQIIFYENSTNFRLAYKDTDFGSASYNFGKSATVGVQLSGSLYNQYSYLQASEPSNRSLYFSILP